MELSVQNKRQTDMSVLCIFQAEHKISKERLSKLLGKIIV